MTRLRRALPYVLFGLVAYGVFLVATVPASRVYALVHEHLGAIQPARLEGSAWSGRAAGLRVGAAPLGDLSWSLSPLGLLTGRLGFDLALAGEGLQADGRLGVSWKGLPRQVQDLKGRIAAEHLTRLAGMAGVELRGTVAFELDQLTLERGRVTGATGRLRWDGAALHRPLSAPLGTLEATLENRDGQVVAQVADQNGPVGVDGTLVLGPDGRYQFRAALTPTERADPQLAQALAMLGRKDAQGTIQVAYSGVLGI